MAADEPQIPDWDSADWDKGAGLLPAIVQDAATGQVLMLGYMNREAAEMTVSSGKVTFFSRSKQRLWTKGETSGNTLVFAGAAIDCDGLPSGAGFLAHLDMLVRSRKEELPEGSYTTSLFAEGKARIAQKVGEEGVELALACMKDDHGEIANEAADLLFHMMVLLADAGMSLDDALEVLKKRHG